MSQRNRLFISYSHQDLARRDAVREQLAVLERAGLIDVFADTDIGAGADWLKRLHEEMLHARIGLLLVSAPFLGSPFVTDVEIRQLIDRHAEGGMKLYPLLIRHCPWKFVPWLRQMQVRPRAMLIKSQVGMTPASTQT